MKPVRSFAAGLLGLASVACGEAPPPPRAPAAAPVFVPLRDTSGGLVEGPSPAPFATSRWASRDVGHAPLPAARGAPIDLDVKDADLGDVCRLLADVGHANIVLSDDAGGRVTVRMKHVPWDQALEVIAQAKGLRVVRDGDVIVVKPAGR